MLKENYSVVKSLVIVISILFSSAANAQWIKQSPVPTHLDIRGVAAPGINKVIIATSDDSYDDGGALFESTNGGSTWTQRNIPFSLNDAFNGLFFLDSQNGWAYGNDNYRTTDGGVDWTQLPFLGSTYFMKFYTPTFGFASGNFGQMVSYDAGNSWEVSPNEMHAFTFADTLIGLGLSIDALFRTTDGGDSFVQVNPGNVQAAAFLTNNIAVAIINNFYFRSTDSGTSWSSVSAAQDRNQIFPVTDQVVISWNKPSTFPSTDGRISRSTDGGLTWTDLGTVIPEGIHALAKSNQNIIASDNKGNMFRSTDLGISWNQTFSSPGPQPGYIENAVPVFPDAQTGYFAYGFGFIIKTIDGGNSWIQISSGSHNTINDMVRFPGGNMLAAADNGVILNSNGNTPWLYSAITSSADITALQVIGNNQAVAVNSEGQVFQSTDGGLNWTAIGVKPTDLNAKDLYFKNLLEGWVTGYGFTSGALFSTTDGGNTWSAVPGISGSYIAVDFEDGMGWVLNSGDIYYRSTDNGATWNSKQLPGFPSLITDIDFIDAGTGYVVGYNGYAARTTDGGNTWNILTVPDNQHNFTSIALINSNELWLSTNNDLVYYSANAGENWAVLDVDSGPFSSFSSIAASSDGQAWTGGYNGYIEYFAGPPPPPLNRPPIASFSYIPSGLTLNFTDTSTDPDGSIVSWLWNFGDTTTSTERNPSHTFPSADTYIVSLTVTDDDGDTGSKIRIIVVQPGPGGTFGDFTEVTPLDSVFVTPQDEDFWVITTAPADFDNDGDIDIAVLGYYVVYFGSVQDRLLILRNDSLLSPNQWGFTYLNIPLGDLTSSASDLAWGDIDNDGDMDLVVGTDGATVLYRNDAGNLILTDTELPGYWEENDQADFDLRSITFADFDNDGDTDLLIPSVFDFTTFSYSTKLMRNDGPNGSGGWLFSEVAGAFAPTSHAQSTWADYDGDQDLDLLLLNVSPLNEDGFIRRYTNEGNGVFTGQDILGDITVEHGEAQWGDYDGDGDLDILIAGHIKVNESYSQVLRIYRNDSEVYTPFEVIDCPSCDGWFDLTAAAWADYDSDGDIDILLAGTYNSGSNIEGRAKIYANNNGVFTDSGNDLPAPRASGSRGGTFSWLDIDGEGDLDYFIAGQYFVPGGNGLVEAQMHVYRNDAEGLNNAPSAPGELNALLQNSNSVLLSWTSATDDHTPAAALTYDLELYRNDIPVSIPNRSPEPGNISAANEWLLTGLPDGNYKWTLRGVDAAYIGSTIAVGQFSIGITSVDENNIPLTYSLVQNYPNPFNPSTKIKFSIPEDGLVTLKVYNSIGEEIKTVVNDFRKAGFYEVTFDASNLPSQIYFYRIQSGNFVDTKKMSLLK